MPVYHIPLDSEDTSSILLFVAIGTDWEPPGILLEFPSRRIQGIGGILTLVSEEATSRNLPLLAEICFIDLLPQLFNHLVLTIGNTPLVMETGMKGHCSSYQRWTLR